LRATIVRRARGADAEAAARVVAAVAEEDFLGVQPPVDVEARAERLRELIEQGALWVLEAEGTVVGYVGAPHTVPGVLSLGTAIQSNPRGRGGGRALVKAV
jgi:hypothetical protein